MRLAYFCCSAEHLPLGEISAASARQHMPGLEIVHLTDHETPGMLLADTVVRLKLDGDFWRRHWTAYAELSGDVICANTDIVFRGDVRHVFDDASELIVPEIRDPRVRYDAGLLFCRAPRFCAALADGGADGLDEWIPAYGAEIDSGRYTVRRLPGRTYSYVPHSAADPCAGALAVHYRGPRKRWMAAGWSQREESTRWMAVAT